MVTCGLRLRWRGMPIIDRFWSYVDITGGPDACWPWTAGTDKDGYGKFQHGGKGEQLHVRAHRFALEITTGKTGATGMHWKCDNPPCCNPTHLRWSTQTENRADCTAKGRDAKGDRSGKRTHPESVPRGSAHPAALLTESQVTQIRQRYVPRRGVGKLAAEFGITRNNLNQ